MHVALGREVVHDEDRVSRLREPGRGRARVLAVPAQIRDQQDRGEVGPARRLVEVGLEGVAVLRRQRGLFRGRGWRCRRGDGALLAAVHGRRGTRGREEKTGLDEDHGQGRGRAGPREAQP